MYKEDLVKMGAVGVAGVEVVGATVAQVAASAGIKSALDGQDLGGISSLLHKAAEVGVIGSGRARALGQVITSAEQIASGAGQPAADACEALSQSVANSPLGGIVEVICGDETDIVGASFEAALKGLETEMLNGGERLLGGLRMAGVMGLASIFLSRYLTEQWNSVLDNEFLAFVAAQGTLVLGSAAINTFVLAPISKLSWSTGDLWRDVGVGFGMAIVTTLGEIAARRLADLEDMGPSVGVFGIALLRAGGAIRGATTLLHFLN